MISKSFPFYGKIFLLSGFYRNIFWIYRQIINKHTRTCFALSNNSDFFQNLTIMHKFHFSRRQNSHIIGIVDAHRNDDGTFIGIINIWRLPKRIDRINHSLSPRQMRSVFFGNKHLSCDKCHKYHKNNERNSITKRKFHIL